MSTISPTTLLQGGLMLVAAGAWNKVARGLIDRLYPQQGDNLWASTIYAIMVTITVTVLIYFISWGSQKIDTIRKDAIVYLVEQKN